MPEILRWLIVVMTLIAIYAGARVRGHMDESPSFGCALAAICSTWGDSRTPSWDAAHSESSCFRHHNMKETGSLEGPGATAPGLFFWLKIA